jgi:hypothetical protein
MSDTYLRNLLGISKLVVSFLFEVAFFWQLVRLALLSPLVPVFPCRGLWNVLMCLSCDAAALGMVDP